MLQCSSCKSSNVKLSGFNWHCNNCGSFTLGNVWTIEDTIKRNATDLNVTIEEYVTISLSQGNDITEHTNQCIALKSQLKQKGISFEE